MLLFKTNVSLQKCHIQSRSLYSYWSIFAGLLISRCEDLMACESELTIRSTGYKQKRVFLWVPISFLLQSHCDGLLTVLLTLHSLVHFLLYFSFCFSVQSMRFSPHAKWLIRLWVCLTCSVFLTSFVVR